jgi:hypothetical protein
VGRNCIAIFLTGGALGFAGLIGGCGSGQTVTAVERAADVTTAMPGYRLSATMSVTTPVVGRMQLRMNGVYDRPARTGSMTAGETVGGRRLRFTELFSGLTFYMHATGIPQLSRLTDGRRWLKFDMSRMLGAMGIGALPTGTDPSQFVDYLRAVGSSETRTGTATVRGIPTTRYHATIDLDRYSKLVPPRQRSTAQRGIDTLESALGSHTLPVDVWIDHHHMVRRLGLVFAECVSGQRIHLGVSMDLYDYGPQAQPSLPRAIQVYDITPLMAASLDKIKFGCAPS